MRLPFHSLNARLILLVTCILIATGAMSGWLTARQQADVLDASMRRNAELMTRNLGDRCAYYLVLQDFAGLENFLMQSVGHADIQRLQVCEANGTVVSDVARDAGGTARRKAGVVRIAPPRLGDATILVEKGELIVWKPVEAGDVIGWIRAIYSMAAIQHMEMVTWRNSLLLSLFWVVCSIALLLGMLHPLVRVIGELTAFARNLDDHKGAQTAVSFQATEIGQLAASLNYASHKLFSSEQELIRERETLREQYSTLRGIIESADALIFSVDRQYRYTSFNTPHASAMRTIYGAEIGVGARMLDFMTVPEDRDRAKQNLDRALAGERFVEYAYSGEDVRSRLYFEVSHNPIIAGDGPAIGVAVLSRDVTERRRSENELRRVNRELMAISKCNEVLMRAKDEDDLLSEICRIICNDAGYRMAWVGYPENDDARSVRPVASAGVDDGYLAQAGITWADTERGRGPTGRAVRNGETVCIQDFATDPAANPWRENALQRGYRSSIALPLKDETNRNFGVLTIYSAEPHAFSASEIRLLGELTGDLAFGIVVLRSRNERKRADEALRRLNDELEERVRERTVELEQKNKELERMNRIFIGRELRMKELKERITALEQQGGTGNA